MTSSLPLSPPSYSSLVDLLIDTLLFNSWLSFAVTGLLALYVYYENRVVALPQLHCNENTKFHSVLNTMAVLQEEYRPVFWCWEPRLHTLMASIVRRSIPNIRYDRQVFSFSDGGQAGLDWSGISDPLDEGQPIVLILPGLTGSSQSEYVKSLVKVATEEVGARCVAFNFRGRGGHQLKSPRTYCAANSDDLAEILEYINNKYPSAPVMAVGVSLGGVILGHYLTSMGHSARSRLVGAMLISTVFNPSEGTLSMELPGLNLMLNRHLAHCLVQSIREVRHQFESRPLDLDDVLTSSTVREFDTRFTSKMFGFGSVDEYYSAAQLASKLGMVKVPTLALNAEDDPFQPGDGIPRLAAQDSSHVAILTTRHGGHIGFMVGCRPSKTVTYSDRVFSQYAQAVFKNRDFLDKYQ